jgi:hypothetical protein
VDEAAVNEAQHQDDGHHSGGEDEHHDLPGDDNGRQNHRGDDDEHQNNPGALPRGQKRKRCAACYREAANRRAGMGVKRVLTSCLICEKPFCVNHLKLCCNVCDAARRPQAPVHLQEQAEDRARNEREKQELQTTIERQRQQIDELQQQVRVLIPLVS